MKKDKNIVMEQKKQPNEIEPVFFQINDLYEDYFFPSHFHDEIEILHVINGKITVTINSKDYVICKNELCFIPGMSIHSIKNSAESSKYDCCLLSNSYFAKEKINMNMYSISPVITDPSLVKSYKELKKLFNNDQPAFKMTAIKSFVTYFVINLIWQNSDRQDTPIIQNNQKIKVINDVNAFLKEHACEEIDIDSICNKYGYSPSYLSRLFKKYTHTTMSKTLNYYRCSNAQRLLMTTDLSITKIAEMCGYGNYSYFAKTYKECIGELPSATKKKYSD